MLSYIVVTTLFLDILENEEQYFDLEHLNAFEIFEQNIFTLI